MFAAFFSEESNHTMKVEKKAKTLFKNRFIQGISLFRVKIFLCLAKKKTSTFKLETQRNFHQEEELNSTRVQTEAVELDSGSVCLAHALRDA
jgi:hypothetical protein